ncbi:MAG: NAD(P)/FAD-dependent oxidoreductase [Peptococcaceae bacterium]|nr:NAD(P)/FAD-dependent oxidoreductase [Peptococcaceae bacterium]
MEDLIVIGAGASGMMAAAVAAQNGLAVRLVEKMPSCGRKIRITGKGRCNVTTAKSHEEILGSIRRNPKFMYSSLAAFDNQAVMAFFEKRGCKLKIERGDRVFPESDHAQDIVDVLVQACKAQGVVMQTDTAVTGVHPEDGRFSVSCADGTVLRARAVIIATGGASYPGTGSTGDAYDWLAALGLKVEQPYPALVPLVSAASWVHALQGLSLRNVRLTITGDKKKPLYSEQGEMLFTHFGVSGPLVLSASGHCAAYWQKKSGPLMVHIDLKPALSEAQLDARLLREIQEMPNKQLASMLRRLLPQKLVPVFAEQLGLEIDQVLHQLSRESRQVIIGGLKDFSFAISGTRPLAEGIVTAGGLSVKAVDPKTMAVKEIPGLFACGEVLDVDAYTGGFNLQIAFSTGYCAGRAASATIKERERQHAQ